MNIEAEKTELMKWIQKLEDSEFVHRLLLLVKKEGEKKGVLGASPRKFGDGKHIFTYVAEDFNDPLDDFKEYM